MQTNCNAYTADVVVLHFIGDNITLYLKYRNQIGSILWEIALNLFVQQFDSFMAEHGYTQNINCFSKLYNDIFARVYLFYHYDKNYDELQFDVIHSFTPLIFEIDTKCIYDGEDDFH